MVLGRGLMYLLIRGGMYRNAVKVDAQGILQGLVAFTGSLLVLHTTSDIVLIFCERVHLLSLLC